MATSKKTTKKRGKKKGAKKASKIEQALTEAQTAEARAKARPPLLRAVFTLVELLRMPPTESQDADRVYGPERDRLEERRRGTLLRGFMGPERFEHNPGYLDLDDVRREIEDTLCGGRAAHGAQASPARIDARELATQLVEAVFDLRSTKLEKLVPTMVRELKAEAEAKRKAEDAERQRKYAEERKRWKEKEDARAKKSASAKKAAKKRAATKATPAKKSAKKPTTSSSPATSTKRPARSKPAKVDNAKLDKAAADFAGTGTARTSSTTTSSPRTPAKPESVTRARCLQLHPTSKDRCMHTQGHDVDEQPHETIGGEQW